MDMVIDNFKATLDLIGTKTGVSKFKPRFEKRFESEGSVEASINVGLPVELAIVLEIPRKSPSIPGQITRPTLTSHPHHRSRRL
jgi:hypothetical protein